MYLLHEKKELEFNKLLMVGKVMGVGIETFDDPFIEKFLQLLASDAYNWARWLIWRYANFVRIFKCVGC